MEIFLEEGSPPSLQYLEVKQQCRREMRGKGEERDIERGIFLDRMCYLVRNSVRSKKLLCRRRLWRVDRHYKQRIHPKLCKKLTCIW